MTRKSGLRWPPVVVAALVVVALGTAAAADAQPADPHRYAVIVGANRAAPGRRDLRYAHNDAQGIADILIRLGGFAYDDVNILLDPDPLDVLAALDADLARETTDREAMLFFYYSGHADADALYPNGHALALSALRARLEDARIRVRIGVIDACRGGGWTGAKGLTPAPPFPVEWPALLANQGSVLIASSSGVEDAHESETLRGSFFTHHWNAGLRGAADANGDGAITASEAFDYAQALTIRDTALVAETPQHPSFHIDLAGRRDVTLVTLDRSSTTLMLQQTTGPLQLVHLDTGLLLLESPRGRRNLRLSVRAGRYLVRRYLAGEIRAKEIELAPDDSITVSEAELQPVGWSALAAKGIGQRAVSAAILPAKTFELQLALGVRHAPVVDPGLRVGEGGPGPVAMLRASFGLGHGWQLMAPLALAYGTGDGEPWDTVVWAGAPVLGLGHTDDQGTIVTGLVGAGVDLRRRAGAQATFNVSASGFGAYSWTSRVFEPVSVFPPTPQPAMSFGRHALDTWSAQVTAGFTRYVSDAVSLNLGVSAARNFVFHGALAPWELEDARDGVVFGIGSVQRRGLRALPLVRVHLSERLTLDGHVAVAYLPASHAVVETYLGGFTSIF
jgi:hypothetical protein